MIHLILPPFLPTNSPYLQMPLHLNQCRKLEEWRILPFTNLRLTAWREVVSIDMYSTHCCSEMKEQEETELDWLPKTWIQVEMQVNTLESANMNAETIAGQTLLSLINLRVRAWGEVTCTAVTSALKWKKNKMELDHLAGTWLQLKNQSIP